jgi:hypothetical protein
MSTHSDPLTAIAAWLDAEAPDQTPIRLIDEARERVRMTAQRPMWWSWAPGSTTSVAVGLGLVVTVLVAVVAIDLLATRQRIGEQARPPATPDAWSRVTIDDAGGASTVISLAASPRGWLAVIGTASDRSESQDQARLYASADGHVWSLIPPEGHPTVDGSAAVVGTEEGFVLVNRDVWFSDDALEWRRLASSNADKDLREGTVRAVAAGGPGYIAVGSDNKAWYSVDGSDWSLAEVPPPPTRFFRRAGYTGEDYSEPSVDMRGVTQVGETLYAWGTATVSILPRQQMMADPSVAVLWASTDGQSWADVLDPGAEDPFESFTAGPGELVAIVNVPLRGGDHPQFVVRVSADGRAWTDVDVINPRASWPTGAAPYGEGGDIVDGMPLALRVPSVTATNAGYVAVGSDGVCHTFRAPGEWCLPDEAAIWTSADGRSWSRMPLDDRFSVAEPGDPSNVEGAWATTVLARGDRFVVGGSYQGQPAIWVAER